MGFSSARTTLGVALLLVVASGAAQAARVEAKSQNLLAVGIVEADRMHIRLSRLLDNAPVRDASVAVTLRGQTHATVAEADGSYTLTDKDLALPGAAALEFQITQGALRETLRGTIEVGGEGGKPEEERSQARQYWWWALNFGVCIGFLMLLSRRKKKSDEA